MKHILDREYEDFARNAESRGERHDELSAARGIVVSTGIGLAILAVIAGAWRMWA